MLDSEDEDYFIPQEKQYAVIELFHDGKYYSTPAATNWLFNKKLIEKDGKIVKQADCFWPPDEKHLAQALLKRIPPKENWINKKCRVLALARTLAGAQESAEAALNASSISESAGESAKLPEKRKRKRPSRFSPTRDDDKRQRDNSSDDEDRNGATTPSAEQPFANLKITQFLKNCVVTKPSVAPTDLSNGEKEIERRSSEDKQGTSSSDAGGKTGKDVAKKLFEDGSQSMTEEETQPKNNHLTIVEGAGIPDVRDGIDDCQAEEMKSAAADTESVKAPSPAPKAGSTSSNFAGGRKGPSYVIRRGITTPTKRAQGVMSPIRKTLTGFRDEPVSHATFTAEVGCLSKKLNSIYIMTKKVYRSTCPMLELGAEDAVEDDTPSLPLKSESDVKKFEEYVKSPDNKLNAIRHFATYGKNTINDSIKAMMPKLFSDGVAAKYNMDGINRRDCATEKTGFKHTPAYFVILAALKKHAHDIDKVDIIHGYNIETIHNSMSLWLKNAPKRHETQKKKGTKGNTATQEEENATPEAE